MVFKDNKKESSRCSLSPSGEYVTGCIDLMVGKDVNGSLIRIFYPSSLSDLEEHYDNWTHWYLGPKYTKGLSKFIMPVGLLQPIHQMCSDLFIKNALIPSVWEAPIAEGGPFPLIVFSHGLAANRSIYSSICNDIASHGFIVAAVEHRDRSACASFTLDDQNKQEWILFQTPKSRKVEYELRLSQVKIRAAECSRALDVMELLAVGQMKVNELSSSFPIESFNGKIEMSHPVLSGHSFGGATTILALSRDKRFRGGICLDPWMYPLDGHEISKTLTSKTDVLEMKELSETVTQPLLFILMECFQDPKNLAAMRKYEKNSNKFWTLLKAKHQNQTDTPMLFRNNGILKEIVGCASAIDPYTAMKLNNYLMINFICNASKIEKPFLEDYQNYIFRNNRWAIEGKRGTAKHMPGWDPGYIRV